MSWHTNAILIHADMSSDPADLFKKLGLTGEQPMPAVSFEEASSVRMTDLAVGYINGWTCLWSNMVLFFIDNKGVARVAESADVFCLTLEGNSGAAGFEWWSGGVQLRKRMVVDEKVVKDEGVPPPREIEAFSQTDDDEQRVLRLMEKLTLPVQQFSEVPYSVFSFPEMIPNM